MKNLIFILTICNIAHIQSFGFLDRSSSRLLGNSSLPDGWDSIWGKVSSLVADTVVVAPPHKLEVSWKLDSFKSWKIEPNAITPVGYMTKRPTLSWPWEQGALYTAMIVDGGIRLVLPKVYIHWMVTNIPGNLVEHGTEVMEYVTPFSLEFNGTESLVKDIDQSYHPMILLVFKQPKYIVVDEHQAGCNPEIVEARIRSLLYLVTKYNLEMKAGNFLWTPYSGYHTQQMVCRFSKCTAKPFPFPLPGVNDLPECMPSQEIMDITVLGPKAGKRKEYSKYRSLLYPDSVTSQILNTFPSISTGVVLNFAAIEGSYDAPYGTNNQAETLDGVIEASFFKYQNASASGSLFTNLLENVPSAPNSLATMSGEKALKIILSKPHDQDFNIEKLLNKRGMVFDLIISKTKEGKEDEHDAFRKQMIAKSRSSRNVVSVTTFDVDQEILDADEGTPLYFDSKDNEISITVFKSQVARRKFRAEVAEDPEFFRKFLDTFTCIMCATMTNSLDESSYPPFNYD